MHISATLDAHATGATVTDTTLDGAELHANGAAPNHTVAEHTAVCVSKGVSSSTTGGSLPGSLAAGSGAVSLAGSGAVSLAGPISIAASGPAAVGTANALNAVAALSTRSASHASTVDLTESDQEDLPLPEHRLRAAAQRAQNVAAFNSAVAHAVQADPARSSSYWRAWHSATCLPLLLQHLQQGSHLLSPRLEMSLDNGQLHARCLLH